MDEQTKQDMEQFSTKIAQEYMVILHEAGLDTQTVLARSLDYLSESPYVLLSDRENSLIVAKAIRTAAKNLGIDRDAQRAWECACEVKIIPSGRTLRCFGYTI